jgi:flagellar biosynthesis/type III secretory pathway protein FliH
MKHDERGGRLTFYGAGFEPGANVVKAADRHRWVELEQLRHEAQVRIEQEIAAGTVAACEAVERRGDALVAERLARLTEAFARAAGQLEQAALDLAVQIATRLVDGSPAEAFFERAAEHLRALVPAGAALTVRVHPQAAGALAGFGEKLQAAGVRHVQVIPDAALPGPRSLVVETGEGEIDLGCETQLRRIVAEVARGCTHPAAATVDAEQRP